MESHFWYNKSQRNGILCLFTILFVVQLILIFVDLTEEEEFSENEFALLEDKIDSLKKVEKNKKVFKIYPFNPNYISDFKAYQLGLTTEQIDLLFAFRERGKFVQNAEEFQEITGINDSLLTIISPYFKFPEWKRIKTSSKKKNNPSAIKDLNKATYKDFQDISGIEYKMAQRIISYRNLLQGFSFKEQLFEVYDLEKETADKLLENFTITEAPTIKKTNINSATFKELLKVPYLDYQLTKKICRYRDRHIYFESLEELKKIDSFPLEKFNRLAVYLYAE